MVRRNLLSLLACWVVTHASITLLAQSALDNDGYAQLSPIDGTAVLNEFRSSRVPGDFCLKFNIIHKPRRGESSAPVSGTLWASWADGGPRLRIEMSAGENAPKKHFLAIKNPQQTQLWCALENQAEPIITSDTAASLLAPGLLLTAFDLQMPFTHWEKTNYVNTERSRGRPVHFYLAVNNSSTSPAKVKFGVDRSYRALTEATYYDNNDQALRVMQIEDFAKVDEQWMISTCSVRDEATRDVDTLKITEAAVRLKLGGQIFDPESLGTPAPSLNAEQFKPL